MKPFFPFLALSIALLPLSDVRAGEKTSFSSTASLPAMMKLNTGMAVNRDTVPVRAALPSEVTAAIPCDAQSVHFARYPLGPGGAPRLVHVWFEPNNLQPGDEDYGGAHHTKSMFEVDVFAPGVKAGTWKRVSFARYKTSNAPDNIQVRFLQPKVRRGAVIALSGNTLYGDAEVQIITLRDVAPPLDSTSFGGVSRRGQVQGFTVGHDQNQSFGVDARGITTVIETTREEGKRPIAKVLLWNGEQYKARAAKR